MNLGVACLIFTAVFVFLCFLPFIVEKWRFNKGVCRCGEKFDLYEYDKNGSRRYTCAKCGYTVWVSYNSVDKYWRDDR